MYHNTYSFRSSINSCDQFTFVMHFFLLIAEKRKQKQTNKPNRINEQTNSDKRSNNTGIDVQQISFGRVRVFSIMKEQISSPKTNENYMESNDCTWLILGSIDNHHMNSSSN